MSDVEHRRRVWEIFSECLEHDAARWEDFLDRAIGDDTEIRREVEALLSSHQESHDFLERPASTRALPQGLADMEDPAGERIGPYEILKLLNRGGMGSVYLAVRRYEGFEKRVALKLLQPDMRDHEEILWRFRTERRILAALDHPNIARFLDGGSTQDRQPYFVMEYVEGLPIDEYCDANKLSTVERLELFRTVCSAVHVAHQNTVVHRDLKPANILVTAEGAPKLLDFGIAKLLNPELAASNIEATMLRPLTPEYASPEQVRNEPITTASDIYALGVLLYRLLTGHPPYKLTSSLQSEMERSICETEPATPSTAILLNEEIPGPDGRATLLTPESVSDTRATDPSRLRRRLSGDLDNIMLMALRKEPRRRYASVEQLSEDIRRHLKGLPVLARPDTLTYRASKFISRHRFGVAAVSAFLIAALAFGIVMTLQRAELARALERSERTTAYLTELFETSDPYSSARELLDAGADKLSLELNDQPEVKADLERTVGVIYHRIGLYDRAAPLLESALETRQRLLGDEHTKVAQSLADLGMLRQQQGDLEDAADHLERSLEIRRALHPGDHADVADNLNELGVLVQQQADHETAGIYLREALAMRRRLGEPRDVAESLNDLAGLLKAQGDDDTAEAHLRQALDIFRRSYGDDHPYTGAGLNNLAFFLRGRGDLERSEELFREALDIFRKRFGNKNAQVADGLHNLAGVLLQRGNEKEAEDLYLESLAMRREVLGNDHIYIAQSLGRLARFSRGRRELDKASSQLHEGLDILRRRLGNDHPLVGQFLVRLAEVQIDSEDHPEAASSLREALGIYRQRLPANHPRIAAAENLLQKALSAN